MLRLSQLARLTPKHVRDSSREVRVTRAKAFIDTDEYGDHKYFTANTRSRGKNKDIRNVIIRLYGSMRYDGAMKVENKCWVHCSCEFFRYYVEVALAARGSSAILSSNGQMPRIRNPSMKPYLCKHLLAATKVVGKTKAKRVKPTKVDELELDNLVKLLEPFIPK